MSEKEIIESLERFERDVHLKYFFADDPWDFDPPPLYMKSTWRPDAWSISPEVHRRIAAFFRAIKRLFTQRRGQSNILPFQHKLLAWLKEQDEYLIAKTDKGLGPCAIEFHRYIKDALVHLNDFSTYQSLTEDEAKQYCRTTHGKINSWVWKYYKVLDKDSREYIIQKTRANANDPYGYFYLMYKVHKSPLKTRPVVSDCASIVHPLGKWVDTQLQPMAKSMPTYFQDSFALKELLSITSIPIGARVFTSDAVAMYPNIKTDIALPRIATYLRDPNTRRQFDHYHPEALIRALEIVMYRSIVRFGDTYRRQISGTMMGTPCAPPWANLFQGLDERNTIIPQYQINLPIFVRFIDDIFGLWVPSLGYLGDEDNEWNEFKSLVNNGCLDWEFSELSTSVNFMDLTISITGDTFTTTLYEKPMALYLYIPPHSSHPPGCLPGHIIGEVQRIHRLCSDKDDIQSRVCTFYGRLMRRGHKSESLIPLFEKAMVNARKFMAKSKQQREQEKEEKLEAARRRCYFHVTFHPQGPKPHAIQQIFVEQVLQPPGKEHFNKLRGEGVDVPLDAMIVANHRPPNLGNMLSYRKIDKRNGPPVSSFI